MLEVKFQNMSSYAARRKYLVVPTCIYMYLCYCVSLAIEAIENELNSVLMWTLCASDVLQFFELIKPIFNTF